MPIRGWFWPEGFSKLRPLLREVRDVVHKQDPTARIGPFLITYADGIRRTVKTPDDALNIQREGLRAVRFQISAWRPQWLMVVILSRSHIELVHDGELVGPGERTRLALADLFEIDLGLEKGSPPGRVAFEARGGLAQSDQRLWLCSFCDNSQFVVRKLVYGPGVHICDKCVGECVAFLEEELGADWSGSARDPRSILYELGLSPIFGRPEVPPRADQCFYLGPFTEQYNVVYEDHIVPALNSQGMTVERADEIFSAYATIDDIWTRINQSHVIVADLSTRNPSVLYEVGIAHTVGKPVVIVTRSMEDVPFDLRGPRCIVYEYSPSGCRELEEALAAAIRMLSEATLVRSQLDDRMGGLTD